MTRTTAREIAMHLIYEMEYHDELPEELFQKVFQEDYYPRLAEETDLYQESPMPGSLPISRTASGASM